MQELQISLQSLSDTIETVTTSDWFAWTHNIVLWMQSLDDAETAMLGVVYMLCLYGVVCWRQRTV